MSPEKKSSFLTGLRSGGGGGGGGGLFGGGGGGGAAPAAFDPKLQTRIAELEKRLAEISKSVLPPEDGEPPKPPTDLMMFLTTRMELLEQKLQAAQEEAVRSNLLLREREHAQRQAQTEVEHMFRSIREQTRAASWDAKLREEFKAAQARIAELEEKIQNASPGSPVIEETVSAWQGAEGREEVEKRVRRQAEEARERLSSSPPPSPPAAPTAAAENAAEAQTMGLVLGRLADLETRLVQAETERDQEKARRIMWEKQVFSELIKNPERFEKTGGGPLLVEASIHHAVRAIRERDETADELRSLLKRIESEPADSKELISLRAKLTSAQAKMQELQKEVLKHSLLLQTWLYKGTAPKK
jgi:hypothetical protein